MRTEPTTAHKILTVSDRTPKERLLMAEFYGGPEHGGKFEWGRDFFAVSFRDGSALMFVLAEDSEGRSIPTEIVEA